MNKRTSETLLSAATSTSTGTAIETYSDKQTYQAAGTTSAGAGSVTVVIEGSNDESLPYVTLGTIILVLSTTSSADGFASDAPWRYVRARVTAISGTGASVTCKMGQ